VRTGAILVEATREHPDGRAAAALIEALDRIVPDVKMDAKPLLKEALALEEEIKRIRETAGGPAVAHGVNQFI
jgi:predicted ATP-grasp superfamily ATP-dependent carboligase